MLVLACDRTMTEPLASARLREKAARSGSTRCTRAALMPLIVWIDRASSPSSARRRFTFCMKEFIPMPDILSKISHPGTPSPGSPASASAMRARAMSVSATEMVSPLRDRSTVSPACSSVCIICEAVPGLNWL